MNPTIELKSIGKKFNREWIFKNVSLVISNTENLAVVGANGSGKSTLLQILAGNLISSEGVLHYKFNDKIIHQEDLYKHISITGPSVQIIEDYTLKEHLDFHQKMKPYINNYSSENIIEILKMDKVKNKAIKYFSSGMKQRVKLVLGVLSNVPFVFLDEPLNNLDAEGIVWYKSLIEQHSDKRLFVVSSNKIIEEYFFCKQVLDITKYKTL